MNKNWYRIKEKGAIGVLSIIIILQIAYFFVHFQEKTAFSTEDLAYFNQKIQEENEKTPEKVIFPFNPNYLSPHKAYELGISDEEYKRLEDFRAENKFVNSAKEFQQLTLLSDSLLAVLEPYFKFPEWVKKNEKQTETIALSPISDKKQLKKQDINTATAQDLKKIYGIGEKLAQNILKRREELQFFSEMEQLKEVYGLNEAVIKEITNYFEIKMPPIIVKKDINEALFVDFWKLKYFTKQEINQILHFREENFPITDLNALVKQQILPSGKIKYLKWYFSAEKNTLHYQKKNFTTEKQDINTATTSDFQEKANISAENAKKIVLLREKLQGFHSFEQIIDAKWLKKEVITALQVHFYIPQRAVIQKINLNKATPAQLTQNFYINKETADKIIQYRKEIGEITDFQELFDRKILSESQKKYLPFYFSVK